jgi:putative ABC transport system permease protein
VAAVTLALGIGATTAVFSIVEAVLLRPLPYRDPSRLAAVWITSTREQGLAKIFATHADFVEFQRHAGTLESVAAATWATRIGRVLTGHGRAREVLAVPASTGFFDTLGVQAELGRMFRPDDEGRGCAIVLAHSFWASTLGANAAIIGKSLTLDQKSCIVLGVMPERFGFYPRQTQAWMLLGPDYQPDQSHMLVGIFVRLKRGVALAQAQSELRSLYRAIHTDSETRDFEPVVYDLQGEFTFLAGRTLRTTLIVAFAAVMLVLLIACLNVANLLLARLSERQRELAVRAALGSGAGRLVRQVLTEGLVLSALGALGGLAIAYAGVRYFRHASPIELSVGADVTVNLPVLVFSGALAVATTLIFGLVPAVRASRVDLTQHLKAAGRGSVTGRRRLSGAVITVEMALSFALLTGAGLLMTSALRMGSEPLGFDPDHLLATRVTMPRYRYPNDSQRLRAYDQLLDRLPAGAVLASKIPPDAGGNQILEVQGRPVTPGSEAHDVGADAVSPGFFDVLKIPLRRGRPFDGRDREKSQPVAIVNDALAREYFPHTGPLGQQIRIPGGGMPWMTIVGVVGNLKHTQLMNEMSWVETPIFYRPLAQEPRSSMQVAVRGGDSREIESAIEAVGPAIPVNEVETLTARLSKTLAYPRFRATVLGFFALGALLLSAVGLHGVLSQLVAQRTPEFGVRRAVGAQTRDLILLVAKQGGVPVLAGLAAGILATIAFSRVLTGLLYGIQAVDPRVIAAVSATLLTAAGVAIVTPARRAARVDPMTALRDE